jgi:hypothetical protein
MTQGNKFNVNLANIGKGGVKPQTKGRTFNPAHVQKLTQSLKDSDGDGVADALEGLLASANRNPNRTRRAAACGMTQKNTLLRRPAIPATRVNNGSSNAGVAVASGSALFSTLVGDTNWGSGGLATEANRVLVSRVTDPNTLFNLYSGRFVRFIRPFINVLARTPGVSVDHELSERIRRLLLNNIALIVDADGNGKEFALAATLFSMIVGKGVEFDQEDILRFGDTSKIYFDYKGVGEMIRHTAHDLVVGESVQVSVEIGIYTVLSDADDENVEEQIEYVRGLQ